MYMCMYTYMHARFLKMWKRTFLKIWKCTFSKHLLSLPFGSNFCS